MPPEDRSEIGVSACCSQGRGLKNRLFCFNMKGRVFVWISIVVIFCVFFPRETAWNAKIYMKKLFGHRLEAEDYSSMYEKQRVKTSHEWASQFKALINTTAPVSKWELLALLRPEVDCPHLIRFGANEESNGISCAILKYLDISSMFAWYAMRLLEANSAHFQMYSVGIIDSPNFETDFQNYTTDKCWIVLVNEEPLKTDMKQTFTSIGKVEKFSKRDDNITALIDVISKHGHSAIDVLKMNIEGDVIPIISSTISLCPIHHILTTVTAEPRGLAKFLNSMEMLGYVLYSWEMDPRKPNTLITSHIVYSKLDLFGFGVRHGTYFA